MSFVIIFSFIPCLFIFFVDNFQYHNLRLEVKMSNCINKIEIGSIPSLTYIQSRVDYPLIFACSSYWVPKNDTKSIRGSLFLQEKRTEEEDKG